MSVFGTILGVATCPVMNGISNVATIANLGIGIATLVETKGARHDIASHQAALDRIEKGMATKEDVTAIMGGLASVKADTSYLHTEVMFAGAGVPVSFDQAGQMRRFDPKMLQNEAPQAMPQQQPTMPSLAPYYVQQPMQPQPVPVQQVPVVQPQMPPTPPVVPATTATDPNVMTKGEMETILSNFAQQFAQQISEGFNNALNAPPAAPVPATTGNKDKK